MLACALSTLGMLVVPLTAAFDQAAFARLEVAGGIAPPVPNSDSEPALTVELTPGYGFRARSERSTLALRLLPRFYYRYPMLGDFNRPLALLRGGVLASVRWSEVLTWSARVNGAFGELDYASTRLAFTQPVARNLVDPVVEVRELEGQTALEWRVRETHWMDLGLLASYTRLIGDELLALPTTLAFGANLGQRFLLDAVSSLSLPLEFRYFDVTNDLDTRSLTARGVYERRVTARDTLIVDAGLTGWVEEGLGLRVLPRGTLSLSSVFVERAGVRLTNGLSAGADVVFDPVLAELRPLAVASWSEQLELGTRWILTARAQGYTSLDPEPLGGTPEERALAQQGETGFGGAFIAAYRLRESFRLDFGLRAETRASHWNADDFRFIDEQVWVFTGLTVLLGFGTHDTPDWMR